MKKIRKLLSFMLALLMVIGSAPIGAMNAFADTPQITIINYEPDEPVAAPIDSGVSAQSANVAKVGNTEYATIDEAISAWTNGTTLTLLADVTLSDVIKLKSTENHTLNLGTYTMTAASGKHAIEITCEGLSSATYALTVNADATNPGGITATGKACIYYSKSVSTKDRPIIVINNGVFEGSYSINCTSNGNTNCPQFWINGGTFNAYVNLTKTLLKVTGGTFNASINCTGDQNAYRLFTGGTFKSWQFMTSGPATNGEQKLTVGNSKNNFDNGVYVDDNGYLVVGGPVITDASDAFKAFSANYSGWSSYLQYSSAKTNGLYYTSVKEALADNNSTSGKVTVYVDELDMTGISYKGTIVVPEGNDITITNAPDTLKVQLADGTVLTPDANGTVTTIVPVEVATYGELVEALANGGYIKLTADITVDTKISAIDDTVIDLNGKTLYVNVEDSTYGNVTIKNGNIVLGKDDVHVCNGYFLVNAGKTLVVDGVKISSSAEGIKGYAVFHLKTGANLDLINSELNISDNEYSAGYIVYAGESTATVDVVGTNVTGSKVNGIVHATTVIKDSTFTITDAIEHGINRSGVTITDSKVAISGGTGRGITAQHGPLVINGNSTVTISEMGEATIELRNNQGLTISDTATVKLDAAVNNTTSGTITGTVILPPKGNNFNGYTGSDAIWGEVWGNARESFVIKVLDANGNVMGTTSLNNIGGIIDGDVNVSWNLKLDATSNTDEYWTMSWTTAPTADNMPAKVELWVDGVKVSGGNVLLNGPDDLNKIYAASADENGKITKYYTSLNAALAAVTDDNQTTVVLRDVTENLTALLRGNIVGDDVTINLTNSDWIYCPYTFVIEEGVTLNVPALFYYAGRSVIRGKVVAEAYYQRYEGTKLTIVAPGSLTVTTEMFYLRYTDGDPNAGIYVIGDNDNSTVELKLAVAYFYQGMINAKDATIVCGTYWQTNETDGQGSANLVLDNSTLTVTVYDHPAKATGNSTVTLKNGSTMDCYNGGVTLGDDAVVSVDSTSEIRGKGGEPVKIAVAKVNGVKYFALVEAFKAATNGSVIEILTDVVIDGKWDCRDYATGGSHSQFKESVTINGNGHTIKFTGTVNDNNWNTIFRFEENATVKNLTVDISEATGAQRVISAKKSLTVDGLTIIGNARYGIIFGESASAADLAAAEIVIKNSTLTGTRRAISDNEGGKDVKSVTITGNTLNANVYASASEKITFNNNTASGEVDLRSYAADNVLSVEAKENTLTAGVKNYISAKTIDAQPEFTTKKMVSTKAELNAALAAAKDGDEIVLTADIDYGTDQLAITKAIILNLGGKTLTTRNAYGGMSVKNNPTIKNGTIVHASNTAAIKVWNATAFENLVIDVQGKGDANKTIGGIVLQSGSTTRVGSIKNVTIKGAALTNGIETYNCGDATENVIGSMENVTIDAKGTGMLISAPCGTATNCDIKGGTNGIEIFIKGNYSASLELVNSKVEGGVFAHDEFSSNPDVVNNGTLSLTVDAATTGASIKDITLTLARAEENVEGVLEDIVSKAQAKVNDTYYATLQAAVNAAQNGETITLLTDVTASDVILIDKSITINGNGYKVTSSATRVFRVTTANVEVTLNDVNMVSKSIRVGTNDIRGISIDNVVGVKLTLNNCSVDFTDASANDWAYAVNVTGGSNHTLTVNDGTYEGANVVNVRGTNNTVIVKDATLTCLYPNNDQYYGACIYVVQDSGSSVSATGNTFNGTNAIAFNIGYTPVTESNNIDNTTKVVAKIGDGYYTSLANAFAAAQNGETVKLLQNVELSKTIKVNANVTLDLNGKTITGTDNATGSFALIEIQPGKELTINDTVGDGKITLTATNNRGWGAYSSVISVQRAKLTVNGGTIEHLGGTDMAYAIDVLTNTGAQSAEAVINGGTIKSTYRAIRQFANSTTGKTILTVNGGTIEGANKSIWMQNANANANPGTVTVGENASLKGDVLISGSGAAKIDMTVSVSAAALKDGSTVTGNKLPATVALKNENGTWGIVNAVATVGGVGYTTVEAAFAAAQNGDEVVILAAGTYKVPTGKNITITGAVAGVVFDNIGAHNMGGASVTFNNVTFDYYPNVNYTGLQHSGNMVYNNCTFNGQVFLYGNSETFNKCTFNQNSADAYNVWTYGAKEVAFNECTFNSAGKSVLIYAESASVFNKVTVTDSTFNASAAVDGKAAIEMDSSLTGGIELTITDSTVTGFGSGNVSGNSLWNNKKGSNTDDNNDITVVVNGETVLAPVTFVAKIGNIGYETIAAAIAAANAGETVTILAGNYTTDISVDKAITVVGETKEVGVDPVKKVNLVNITGKLNVIADGATVKHLNVKNEAGEAGYIYINNAKDVLAKGVLIEGCTIVGASGFAGCSTNVTVKFQDSTIRGEKLYGIQFTGAQGGKILVDNCVISGWTTFGSAIETILIENSKFVEAGSNTIRLYQDVVFENTVFSPSTTIDFGTQNKTANFKGCSVSDGSDLIDRLTLLDTISPKHDLYIIDGVKIFLVAKIGDNNFYLSLADAIAAANEGDIIEILVDLTITEDIVKNVTIHKGTNDVNVTGKLFAGTYDWDVNDNCGTGYYAKKSTVDDVDYWTVVKATIIDTGRTLSLTGQIYINQYVKFEGYDDIDIASNGGLLIWYAPIDEANAIYGQKDATVQEGLVYDSKNDEYSQRTTGIVAKQYADVMYFRVYLKLEDGTYVYGPLKEYSVRQYCEAQIAKDNKAKDVCIQLLHYGAAAQIYFKYRTDDLANKNIAATYPSANWSSEYLTDLVAANTSIIGTGDIKDNGKTLSLTDGITINYYFKPTGDYTVVSAELIMWSGISGELTLENATYTTKMKAGNGEYSAQSKQIAASKLGDTVYACAHFVDEDGYDHYSDVIAYSPEQYAAGRIKKSTDVNLVALVKAMVLYGEEANEYMANKNK